MEVIYFDNNKIVKTLRINKEKNYAPTIYIHIKMKINILYTKHVIYLMI